MMLRLKSLILVALVLIAIGVVPVRAADEDTGGSFLSPFPEGDVYQVAVIGDSFADGLLAGLLESFASDTRLNIQKKPRALEGIMSAGFEEKLRELEEQLVKEPASIVVVMVGEDDRVALKSSSNKRVAIMSPEWRTEYARRLDKVMKAVKQRNSGVYWVGLPNLARTDANEQAQGMNEVIRERAYQNGFRYVDTYAGFTDESGAYSAYGPDLAGKVRVLREGDGVHFTEAGNRKLAHFVEKEMRRDLNQAKAERSIPLAGNEAEQAKINPDNSVKVPAPSSPAAPEKSAETKPPVVTAPAADPNSDQKADNGKIALKILGAGGKEEVQMLEIVRPAIPASVVSLMARREGAGQMGDLLVDQIAGGLTLMNSVTPSGQKGPGKLSPSQAPYFRLLVKGERLAPKAGRADDVIWTKPDSASDAAKAARQPKG
ncbi:MAG: GDSL-type esterase/lipase family protein [Hyphomicrobium sp.]